MNNEPEYLDEKNKIYSRDDIVGYQGLTEQSEGVKVCQACGKLFIPKNGRQKFCLRTHYKKCVICGKEFKLNLANGIKLQSVTCSKECRNKYRAYISKTPEVVEKSKQTNLQKYGVENGAQSKESKEKIRRSLTKAPKKITLICAVCGKTFEVSSKEYKRKCCSKECSDKLKTAHNYKIRQSIEPLSEKEKDAKKKLRKQHISETNKKIMNSPEVREKIRQSNLNKYGVDNVAKVPEIKAKISKSVKANYEDKRYRNKVKQAQLDKFGGKWASQTQEFKNRVKQTNIEKYGTEYATQSPEIKLKIQNTMFNKYGVYSASQIDVSKATAKQHRLNSNMNRYGEAFPLQRAEILEKKLHTQYNIVNSLEFDTKKLTNYGVSPINQKFHEFLNQYNIRTEYEYPIETRSFDIRIQNSNILVEIDPSISHCFTGTDWAIQDKNYHLMKSELAKKHKFHCIHVFDWDDWNKILMLLQPQEIIYARKCRVIEIDQHTADIFTDKYHIQGKCNGQKLNAGLYYQGELVEVMTFGKPRYAKKYDWELLRLCTKSNLSVIGGASKLFKFILQNHSELNNIISYCDRSKFNGNVYYNLGFNLERTSEPQEIWAKDNKYVTANMLRARGYDQIFKAHYGKGTDNNELMLEHGWLPVYDCGQLVFSYRR